MYNLERKRERDNISKILYYIFYCIDRQIIILNNYIFTVKKLKISKTFEFKKHHYLSDI